VAFLPLVLGLAGGHTQRDVRCAPAATTSKTGISDWIEGLTTAMELFVLLAFFLLLTLASVLGWTADSRDSADWTPSNEGRRRRRLRVI
jgi:hypothetical protein